MKVIKDPHSLGNKDERSQALPLTERKHILMFNSSVPEQDDRHFARQQFQTHFLVWTQFNSDSNFTEICSQESNWQYASIGSDNGLEPSMRQAIIWTNAYPVHQRIYVALGGDGLSSLEWKHEVLFWQHIYDIS